MDDVIAVNWERMVAISNDGTELRICLMVDADGDETDDPDEARAIVAAHPDGTWWSVDMTDFDPVSVH